MTRIVCPERLARRSLHHAIVDLLERLAQLQAELRQSPPHVSDNRLIRVREPWSVTGKTALRDEIA
jgi:hypothetical protein